MPYLSEEGKIVFLDVFYLLFVFLFVICKIFYLKCAFIVNYYFTVFISVNRIYVVSFVFTRF